MNALWLVWPVIGMVAHIVECNRMKTWCGKPIWEEPSTYAMLVIAAMLGPLIMLAFALEPGDRK